ncbi:hypothetical protein PtB15_2B693 [Puccinia triticina]|nr:hypothetical protein PtB15_2B693 [Puccinia triticina]
MPTRKDPSLRSLAPLASTTLLSWFDDPTVDEFHTWSRGLYYQLGILPISVPSSHPPPSTPPRPDPSTNSLYPLDSTSVLRCATPSRFTGYSPPSDQLSQPAPPATPLPAAGPDLILQSTAPRRHRSSPLPRSPPEPPSSPRPSRNTPDYPASPLTCKLTFPSQPHSPAPTTNSPHRPNACSSSPPSTPSSDSISRTHSRPPFTRTPTPSAHPRPSCSSAETSSPPPLPLALPAARFTAFVTVGMGRAPRPPLAHMLPCNAQLPILALRSSAFNAMQAKAGQANKD